MRSRGRARIGAHRHRARSRGVTLTELMAVVAIIGVLATLAIAAFNRRAHASNVSEAAAVLRSIGVAEEQYRSLNQVYLNVTGTAVENEGGGWYPVDVVPKNKKVSFVKTDHADWPNWRRLNAQVHQPVGFSFKVHAGLPSAPVDAVAIAANAFQIDENAGNEPWYVAQARADADGDGTYCVLVASSFMAEVRSANDGE